MHALGVPELRPQRKIILRHVGVHSEQHIMECSERSLHVGAGALEAAPDATHKSIS